MTSVVFSSRNMGFAIASTARGLIEDGPCLVLEELVVDTMHCANAAVMSVVSEELAKMSCLQQNLRQETLLLNGVSDIMEAKYILTKVCKGQSYQACTSWEDVAVNGCDFETVMEEIESNGRRRWRSLHSLRGHMVDVFDRQQDHV